MAAPGITEGDVFRTADELLAKGERPTNERIRAVLGRGSPNTVTPHLNTWFRSLAERIKDPVAFRASSQPQKAAEPTLSEPYERVAKSLWELANAEARADFDERLRTEIAKQMEAALANVNAHKERADLAGAAAFESEAHARRLERDLTSLTESFDAERIAHAGSREALHSAQGRVEELTHQVARIAKERDDERSEAKRLVAISEERSAAAERRALHEIEASRAAQAAAEKRAEVANRRGDAADERARAATVEAGEAQAETAQVRDRLMTETRQLTSNLAEQTALLRSAAGELDAVRSQSETRGSDLLAARGEVDQLRAELREKDRELGLSIGRADAANELLKAFGATQARRKN